MPSDPSDGGAPTPEPTCVVHRVLPLGDTASAAPELVLTMMLPSLLTTGDDALEPPATHCSDPFVKYDATPAVVPTAKPPPPA